MKEIKKYIGFIIALTFGLQAYAQPPVTCQSSTKLTNGSFENTTCTAPTNHCAPPQETDDFNFNCVSSWSASHGTPAISGWAKTGSKAAYLRGNGSLGQGIYQKYYFPGSQYTFTKDIRFSARLHNNRQDVINNKGTLYVYFIESLSPANTCVSFYENDPFGSRRELLWTIDLSTLSFNSYTTFHDRFGGIPIHPNHVNGDFCNLMFYVEGDAGEEVGVLIDDVFISTAGCIFNYPIDIPSTASRCSSIDFKFSVNSHFPYNSGATNITWDFGDGNSSTEFNPTHSYARAGTYTITAIGNDFIGCRFSSTATITIPYNNGNGNLSMTGYANKYTCDNFSFGFNYNAGTNSATPETVTSIEWDFNDGTTVVVNNPAANHIENHQFTTPGTHRVDLRATLSNGCSPIIVTKFIVISDPNLTINTTTPLYQCEVSNFSYTTNGDAPTSVLWKFNDATGAQSTSHTPSFTYANDGTYTLELEADYGNGCKITTTKQVTILDRVLSINANSTAKKCESVNFSYSNFGTAPTFVKWEFGDAANTFTFDNNPNFSYDATGTYTVKLTATWGVCQVVTTKQITINDRGLSISMPSLTCHTTNNSFSFTPIDADVTTQTWNFGDGSPTTTVQSPTHQFTKGNYTVTLTVEYASGCTVTETGNIIVENPVVSISTTPTITDICIGDDVTFQYITSNLSNTAPTSWIWDFGDGSPTSTAISPNHQYNSSGVKTASLTLNFSSGCTVVKTQTVNVEDPSIGFVLSPNQFCTGDPVTMPSSYLALSQVGNTPHTEKWNFGDGSPEVTNSYGIPPPTHTYNTAGNYAVTLTATFPGNCEASSTVNIVISDYMTKNIAIEGPTTACFGNQVQFNATGDVSGATFDWSFDNGQNSTAQSPSTYFTDVRSHTVSLTATYAQNCITTNPVSDQIIVEVDDYDYCSSCEECIGSFAPQAGEKYVLSAWVKEEDAQLMKATYVGAGIALFYEGDNTYSSTFKGKGPIIEGWQQVEEVFEIPEATSAISIELLNEGSDDVYFDDIRIYPFNANLKSFVYDPITMRLTAELDENNYATFYEYDEDGNLIRVKKETERGVKTIQETVKRTKQE